MFDDDAEPECLPCGQLPEHIRAETAIIQQRWTPVERLARSRGLDVADILVERELRRRHVPRVVAFGVLDGILA